MFETDIIDALRQVGLRPIEMAGWPTRGDARFNPRGSVNHHTAGPRAGNHPSLKLLTNGVHQANGNFLKGPLSNVSLARNLDVNLIAAGRANHAGAGSWRGLVGNSSVWGLEVEHTGNLATEGVPSAEKWEVMFRIHAAFALLSGFDASMVCQHFEWAPRRKIDFIGATPGQFRDGVQKLINLQDPEEIEMKTAKPMLVWSAGHDGKLDTYVTDCITKQKITTPEHLDLIRFFGVAEFVRDFPKPGDWLPFNWSPEQIAAIPEVAPGHAVGEVSESSLAHLLQRQRIVLD